ncbi:MFS transporter [Actinokineospora globicatena]|uniref:MFS transporter n=1 Tax=Actinokineospora globicatena TaxID=103729 RepID=UPI0020A4433B|nr:MFS transporter [Actinokineospora globicatena]MCP2302585.1 putative arabinose efflux permease, MFS family [Actinokineospora globicatena]GLW75728.1 MFS transporter [Actinokineospora globicatena]GLW82568.1 MFS transporter [Actinokineospora globicatena]
MTSSLRHHGGFRLLWAGDTIAQFGTAIASVVLPLLAVGALNATPGQMGVLVAAETAAFLLIGLPAGAWVDRVRRRPLMIRMDLVRTVLLLSIPVAGWAGVLTFTQLVVVALLVGTCTVFFDVAYQSYLPALVGREHLMEGNAKLQASQSVAIFAGPALGGGLTTLIGAASTLASTGLGYLASALCLSRIPMQEPMPRRLPDRNLRAEVAEGLRFVVSDRRLRAITGCTASWNLFFGVQGAVSILFMVRVVGLSEAAVGVVLGFVGLGGIAGAALSARVIRVLGHARAIWLVPVIGSAFGLLIPLAGPDWRLGLLVVGQVVLGSSIVVYNVAQVSYRQAICPDHLLGRMNASIRFLVWGTQPLGALAGGALGTAIGIHPTLWIAVIGPFAACLWVVCSPLRTAGEITVSSNPEGTDQREMTEGGEERAADQA